MNVFSSGGILDGSDYGTKAVRVAAESSILTWLCIPFFFFGSCCLASIFRNLRFPRISSDSAEHSSELNHSRARLFVPESSGTRTGGIQREDIMLFCATLCNEHSLRRQKKQVSKMAFCRQPLLLPRPSASRYAVLSPLLPMLDQRQ